MIPVFSSKKNTPDAKDASSATPEVRMTLERAETIRKDILAEVGKRVYGQQEVVELLLTALVAQGHTLMIGVPGLAKTLLVSTLAQALGLDFNRIQFTPDLMPSDITGTDILEEDPQSGKRVFRFLKGPVFTNLLLADEINRTPPKTQAALLQAMQEHTVTAGGRTYPLDPPFLVFATQNPIEQEGTYPLPEAQLDRFMFHVELVYPSAEDERRIARWTTTVEQQEVQSVVSHADILAIQRLVREMEVSDTVIDAAVELVRATRPQDESAPEIVRDNVSFGAGPRAVQALILGAKARAVLRGYEIPSLEDIYALAPNILGHRILVNFRAEAENIRANDVVAALVDARKVKRA